jgi:hypothetical protein
MFRHVSLLKFNDPAAVERVTAEIAKLPGIIPALREYRFGPDAGLADGNFDLGIVADFDDVAGYEEYRDNPEHRRIIAEVIRPVLADRAAVQYTC